LSSADIGHGHCRAPGDGGGGDGGGGGSRLSVGAIVGIVVGSLVLVAILVGIAGVAFGTPVCIQRGLGRDSTRSTACASFSA